MGASGSGSGSPSGSSSGGFGSSGSSGGTDDGGVDLDGGGPGSGADCGNIPTLHPNAPGDIFCLGMGTNGLTCSTGTECCSNADYTENTCISWNDHSTGCPSPAIGIACNQVSDCYAANGSPFPPWTLACCLQGASMAPVAGCGYPRAKDGTAVVCEWNPGANAPGYPGAVACAAGEIQICQSQADCPVGKTCTPGEWGSFQVGFCM
jgi:hypothetical protein